MGTLVGGIAADRLLRGLILVIAIGSVIVLRTWPNLSLKPLRWLELVVFGLMVIQLSVMLVSRLEEFASWSDATSIASVRQQTLTA